jgi:glycosyltransferase involved in cell wall biosynthesis
MIELSLAIIAKDEEENLDACLSSIRGCVDEIVVVDTGSTDRTIDVAVKHGSRVYPFNPTTNPEAFFKDDDTTCTAFGAPGPFSGEVMLGDFGAARRCSFAQTRGEFVLWLDSDDVLEGAEHLRTAVATMKAQRLDMGFLAYDYARDHVGRTFYRQWRERIIRRDAATWVNPVHEVLMPTRNVTSQRFEGLTVAHRRKADRKNCAPNRNYKILLRQYHQEKQNGTVTDPRTLFYLGQEARWVEPVKAATFYEEYLQRSGWPEERAAAHVALGSMREFGQLGGTPAESYAIADREYAVAAAEMPGNPDGLFGMARIAYLRERWQECVDYTARAQAIGNTESMLGANPMDRLYRPHVYLNYALHKLGRLEDAVASCRAGLAVCPDDPGVPNGPPGMLRHNLDGYERELAARAAKSALPTAERPVVAEFDKNEDVDAPARAGIHQDVLIIWAMQLWKQNVARNDEFGARGVLRAISWIQDPAVERMRAATDRRWAPPGAGATVLRIDPQTFKQRTYEIYQSPGMSPQDVANAIQHHEPEWGRKVASREGSLRIVFYLGPCFERWDPTSLDRGIGGSETAAIHMAHELAARGHNVNVYADPETPGTYEGVCYRRHEKFAGGQCDVFIASRAPWAISQFGEVRAPVKLLWVHDVDVGPDSPQMQRHLLAFDRVLCLSQWHRGHFLSQYPGLDPEKVLVTRNGIDPGRFSSEALRCGACGGGFSGGVKPCPVCNDKPASRRNRLVWSSSPPRGLDNMLYNFRLVRQHVPDAELHVYYGFDCWEAFARSRGSQPELDEIARYRALLPPIGQMRDGVVYHGRVGQRELAEAFLRAKVWPYLTGFPETSCISAMEAQAAGCLPVCSNVAALPETVKHGILVDVTRADAPQAWFQSVVRALTDEEWRRPQAEAARAYALENLSWRALAGEWEVLFARVAEELRANPLSKYVEVG